MTLDVDATRITGRWVKHAPPGSPPLARRDPPREVDVCVANLSDAARLSRVGLSPPRPGRRSWPPYQRVGETLAGDGWAGLVAPSAARPAGRVLCLFRTGDGSVPAARPVPPPARVEEPPAPPTGMTT